MKIKLYLFKKSSNQILIRIPQNIVKNTNLKNLNVIVNKIPFQANIIKKIRKTKKGKVIKEIFITIPKPISKYLKLKDKKYIDFKLK